MNTKNFTPNSAEFYACESCNFTCSKTSDFDRHLLTAKHTLRTITTPFTPKNAVFKTCDYCNVICSKASDYSRHILTAKHAKRQKAPNFTPKNADDKSFACACGKKYKHKSSLWNHSQTCMNVGIRENAVDPSTTIVAMQLNNANNNNNTLMLEILKQNQEFKELIIGQNEKMQEQTKTIIELASKAGNNNMINSNNKFNLNLFLNETCKDAMNMNDFIQNMQITPDELENVGKNGYVNGISGIILSRIKQLDISKRPLHCTDLKRETMYIRDDNVWNKDSEDNAKLRHVISRVAKKNLSKIPEWREQHPNCLDYEHEQYDFCINLFRNSLGEAGDDQIKVDEKIIKVIARLVMVDKNA